MSTLSNMDNGLMPFETLDDDDFAKINHNFEKRFTQYDMDRLSQMKFNPFAYNGNIAFCKNNETLDKAFDINETNWNYYLPHEFGRLSTEIHNKNSFSLIHLNIRSMINKFASFKELRNCLDVNFKLIGLSETWLKFFDKVNFELLNYDYIGSNRANKKMWRCSSIYCKTNKQLRYKIRKDLKTEIQGTIATIFIEINRDSGKNIIIGLFIDHLIINWRYFKMK